MSALLRCWARITCDWTHGSLLRTTDKLHVLVYFIVSVATMARLFISFNHDLNAHTYLPKKVLLPHNWYSTGTLGLPLNDLLFLSQMADTSTYTPLFGYPVVRNFTLDTLLRHVACTLPFVHLMHWVLKHVLAHTLCSTTMSRLWFPLIVAYCAHKMNGYHAKR